MPLGSYGPWAVDRTPRSATPCRRTGSTLSQVRRNLWSRKDGPYGQEFAILEEPTPDATSGFSQ
ncbi:hypothetical protein O181_125733, partial [Austropuccinia psidii MF-1]|nr:hypothetical protein [Austropuccinia psidii MF-1]